MNYTSLVFLLFFTTYLTVVKCDLWWSTQTNYPQCFNTTLYPRFRQNWCDLTYQQRQTWVRITTLMRNTPIPGYPYDNYYKAFADVHSVVTNSNPSHGTTIFPLWHRTFMYHVESCYRFFAYQNRVSLGLTVGQACSTSLPYWAWEEDYDNDTADSYIPVDHSCIWQYPELFGPAPTHPSPVIVPTGPFCPANWTTNYLCNNDPVYFASTNPKYGPQTYSLKRAFSLSSTGNFTYGPAQMMYMLSTNPKFQTWEGLFEGGPHSVPHLWLGYDMQSMRSPEDPLFFLHHGNIERFFTMYQDCWDYEFASPNNLTYLHYNASNPNPWPYPFQVQDYKLDVYNNVVNVGIDFPMTYWWKAYMIGSSTAYTFTDTPWMKNGTWPSPRMTYFVGFPEQPNKGYLNMTYTYGNDLLVNNLGQSCKANTRWTYFPSAPASAISKKRNVDSKFEVSEESEISKNLENSGVQQSNGNANMVYSRINDQLSEMRKKGLCDTDALEALAIKECQQSPKPTFPPEALAWMAMNGLKQSQFERVCDNIDESDDGVVYSSVKEDAITTGYRQVNIVIIIGAVIGGVVLLILTIVLIVVLVRKGKREVNDQFNYLNM